MHERVKCGNCYFYQKWSRSHAGTTSGQCRLRPPVVLPDHGESQWPQVGSEAWCGSWQEHEHPAPREVMRERQLRNIRAVLDQYEPHEHCALANIDHLLRNAGFFPNKDRSGNDDWADEVHAHREALDAILVLTGHDPYVAECYNDPHFGETVRQAVEEALGGAPGCGVRRYLILIEGLLAARAVSGGLSQETEAELAEVHDMEWRKLADYEHAILDGDHGLIEKAKARWMNDRSTKETGQ